MRNVEKLCIAGIVGGTIRWAIGFIGRQKHNFRVAVLGWLLESIPRASSALEIGCGTGHFSRWLSRRGLAAVGLDLSAAMLAQARALDGVPLVQGNAFYLPFADDTFDVTALIATLEFLTLPRQALAEALRVSRHGIVLGVLNRWSPLGLQRRLAGLFRPTIYDTARFYGVGELKRLSGSVAGGKAHVVWRTTLFHRAWPWAQMHLPWRGFIGMALVPSPSTGKEETRWRGSPWCGGGGDSEFAGRRMCVTTKADYLWHPKSAIHADDDKDVVSHILP